MPAPRFVLYFIPAVANTEKGWPGHPAPSCDPNAKEDECCPGTHCTIDSIDPTLHVCRPDATLREVSFSSYVLAARAEHVLKNIVTSLKEQAIDSYYSSPFNNSLNATGEDEGDVDREKVFQRAKELSKFKSFINETEGEEKDDSFLRDAAFALLDADIQLRRSPENKREALEKVKEIIASLQQHVDRKLQEEETPSNENGDGATQSPSSDDFWGKYLPHIPIESGGGDRRPGSLGGPCGLTAFRDFGPCVSKPNRPKAVCVGATPKKPGVCRINSTEAETSFHKTVQTTKNIVSDLESASLQLVLAQQQQQQEFAVNAKQEFGVVLPPLQNTTLGTMPDSDVLKYTSSTYLVVLIGALIIAYFCCARGNKQAYRPINDGWGSAAPAAASTPTGDA